MRDDDEDDRRELRRRSSDQPPSQARTVATMLGIVIASLSIVGSVFAAGYNWRSVTEIEKNQDKYVLKESADLQYRNVMDRMSELSRQLEEIRAEQIRARGTLR